MLDWKGEVGCCGAEAEGFDLRRRKKKSRAPTMAIATTAPIVTPAIQALLLLWEDVGVGLTVEVRVTMGEVFVAGEVVAAPGVVRYIVRRDEPQSTHIIEEGSLISL